MKQHEHNLLENAYKAVEENRQNIEQDPYRLHYHLMPPVGLLNDPNGFIHFRGLYHLFYQWNPFETAHGAKFWGHYTSPDMVNWTHEPIALAPSEWYEKNGCYSGSAVEHEGKMVLFYTGNVKNEHGERETYQCMAISEDGFTFEKKGPVVHLPEGYTAHFRDPKVWKQENKWYMVLGAQDLNEQGKAVLYTSDNLIDWEFLGPIAGADMNGLGSFGYMWECPDLFELDGKEVLLLSPQGLEPEGYLYQNIYQSGYFVGKMEYETPEFSHREFIEIDRGFDFYAPQTTLDTKGRRLLFAWMGITDENEKFQPTIKSGWVHAMTLPRELTLKGDKLYQQPVEELQQLRKEEVFLPNTKISTSNQTLENVNGTSIELEITIIKNDAETFEISFRDAASMVYSKHEKRLSLHRKKFTGDAIESRHCHVEDLHQLQVFLDTSSIEIFVNGGAEVFTARFFPSETNQTILFSAEGNVMFDVKKWKL
ncbi:glycoside hydrolase family 32 protein [Fredinandcohnia humi]